MKQLFLLAASTLILASCSNEEHNQPPEPPASTEGQAFETEQSNSENYIGSIEMNAPGIIAEDAKIENLGGSFGWSEGPVWIAEDERLLFTDVPGNIIWSYKDGEGLTKFLEPSGFAGEKPNWMGSPGANGLIRYGENEILLPSHGERGLYAMDLDTKDKRLIVDKYECKKFNSPNDAVVHKSGAIFFTDPPYGLAEGNDSEAKEISFNGVYAYTPGGDVTLIDDKLTRPNGIILSPNGSTLYVANSDPEDTIWKTYPVADDGTVGDGAVLLDATEDIAAGVRGNADGMAVDIEGRLYATGPGGVLMISPEGERLGLIQTGKPVANVTFGGPDGNVLYMTSADILARVPTLVKGHGL
ncbi:SMP-30/gluconolactonase/LRE family protein [Litorimonas haliclonae]|uniref:SMP-30/gluconolactonase/LRE family protein n=1 Tax=Litorimonas haliclonae TaxID=2081977 RepID=UPI0039F0BE43